ncbi:MAG: C10 family peptidase, partial [Bacteroidales bacterium]
MTTFYSKVGSMIVLCLLALNLFSNPVDQRKAQEIGLHFMQNVIKSASKQATCEPVYSIGFQIGNDRGHAFYVFNINADSYVIVAGDDRVKPILGYSTEGRFDTEKVPANMMTFLNDLGKQIEYAVQNNVTVTDQIRGQWQSLSSTTTENSVFQNNRSGVQPLLTTKWDQNGFYNALCPADNDGPNGHAYAGCVATALAQIINYWEYPVHGTGTHAYTDPLYGQHTVNFATAHYRYAVMPNQIEISPQSHLPNDTMGANAIATLIYHCGVAVNMEYAPDGSSAYDAAARAALISYFGYNPYLSIA